MSASTSIRSVSESLRAHLKGKMELPTQVEVTILPPDQAHCEKNRLNLFLYKVQESPTLKNMDWQVKPDDPTQLAPPPLSLNLFYLVTSYTGTNGDTPTGNSEAHQILGEAMRVLYEYPIVPREHPVGDLAQAREQLKVMLSPLDPEELSRIWSTFSQPFRLSVMYEVSVVQLDAKGTRPLPTRVRDIGPPEVEPPFQPPVVDKLEPQSGLAGTSVTFTGRGLAGRQADVTLTGQKILAGEALAGDSFAATVPADVVPGFHELRVDISKLFRRTFFFEVTPAIDRMAAQRQPGGTSLTFYGRDLAGQQATVTVGDIVVMDGETLTEDQFSATIPPDLSPGTYEIGVDLSHSYRKTFLFEVKE